MKIHRKQHGYNAHRSIVMESINIDTAITWEYDDIIEGETAVWNVGDDSGDYRVYRFRVNRFQDVNKMVAVHHQRAVMMAFAEYAAEHELDFDEFYSDNDICAVKNIVE